MAPFRACVALVRELRDRHAATAAVSTAPIGTRVLTAAQVASLFDVRVDRSHLDGQPTTVRSGGTGQREERDLRQELEEAVLAESVRRLRLPPTQTAVVQRSLTGVRAARRLGFGLVVGVDSGPTVEVSTGPGERTSRDRPSTDRASNERELRRAGAHLVVRDLAQLDVAGRRRPLVKPV